MSASVSWNKKINNPSEEMMSNAKSLYENMSIKVSDVVRWDIHAMLISRLGQNLIFKELSWDSKTNKIEFKKKLTLCFKVFAGIFQKGITKDDVEKMGSNTAINWNLESQKVLLAI